jgi:polyhydroxyalkanoate synthesis regulator phasin
VPSLADFADGNDLAHRAMAQATQRAITELANHVQQLADSFLLAETAADGLGIALTNVTALQQTVTDLQTTVNTQAGEITTLQQQVAALQAGQPAPAPTTAAMTATDTPIFDGMNLEA